MIGTFALLLRERHERCTTLGMHSDPKQTYLARNSILNLLSDAEVAKVSTAEDEDALCYGDEYIDLERLDLGVQKAFGETPPIGRLLPRKAVRDETWVKLLAQVATTPNVAAAGARL